MHMIHVKLLQPVRLFPRHGINVPVHIQGDERGGDVLEN